MESRKRVTLGGIWRSLYPVLVYLCIQFAVSMICAFGIAMAAWAMYSGAGYADLETYIMNRVAEETLMVLLASMMVSIPVFGWLYYRDVQKKKQSGWSEEGFSLTEGRLLWTAVGCAALAMFCNGAISLLPLAQWSDSYEEVSETLYSGNVWIRIACVGLFGPVVEELVMRGLLYQRLRSMMRPGAAMFWSALAFGIIHGNIVQGVYAFLVGLFFAWLMEYSHRILIPIAGHMAANLFVLLLEDCSLLEIIYGSVPVFLTTTIASGIVFWCSVRIMKNA